MGTAEALVRVLDATLPFDARERLALAGINCVRHVIPGKFVLLAGTKSGLLMRRVLQLLGITDAVGRARIDEETMAFPVEGPCRMRDSPSRRPRNDDGVLKIVAQSDGLSPAELFAASLRHGNDMLAECMAVMDRECPRPPRPCSPAAGRRWHPWCAPLRAAAAVTVSTHDEGTAYGAALFAAFAVDSRSFEDVAETFLSSPLLTTERS